MSKILGAFKIVVVSIVFALFLLPSQAVASTETPINVNQQYSGALSQSGDIDYYRFQLSEAGKVQINFQHDLIDSSSTYWKVYVLDASNNEHYCMNVEGREINKNSWNIYLPAGSFFLKVTNYSYSGTDYIFRLDYTASNGNYEEEFNTSMTSANVIRFNHQYTGSMFESGDVDYFYFHLSAAGPLQINFQHDLIDSSSTYWKVYLVDSNNEEQCYVPIDGRQTTLTSNQIYLEKGDYYLKISNYSYSGTDYRFMIINENAVEEPAGPVLQWPAKDGVALDHQWTIRFSLALDPNTINDRNIYIGDSYGGRIDANVTPGSDGRTVLISLDNTRYQPAKEYTLYISTAVKSASGLALTKAIQMKFSTIN